MKATGITILGILSSAVCIDMGSKLQPSSIPELEADRKVSDGTSLIQTVSAVKERRASSHSPRKTVTKVGSVPNGLAPTSSIQEWTHSLSGLAKTIRAELQSWPQLHFLSLDDQASLTKTLRSSSILSYFDAHFFFGAFAVYSMFAIVSIVNESTRLQAKPAVVGRDNFFDVAKFMLICAVWSEHLNIGYPVDARPSMAWRGSASPAFFIISGILSNWGEKLSPRKELLLGTLRDCVLNNILFMICSACPPSLGPLPFGLWILVAQTLYRFGLGFLFQVHIRALGTLIGASLLLVESLIFTWAWMTSDFVLDDPYMYETNSIAVCGVFFVLGLVIRSFNLHGSLNHPVAFSVAVPVWGAFYYVVVWMMHPPGTPGDVESLPGGLLSSKALGYFRRGDDELSSVRMWFWTVAMRACLALGLIALAYPITRAPVISELFARLGRRSLYGYVLQMCLVGPMFRYGVCGEALGALYSIHPLVAVVGVFLSMAVLCSPLAEATFSWLVSPAWALQGIIVPLGHFKAFSAWAPPKKSQIA